MITNTARTTITRAFAISFGLNVRFVLLEAGIGLWANSLALLAALLNAVLLLVAIGGIAY